MLPALPTLSHGSSGGQLLPVFAAIDTLACDAACNQHRDGSILKTRVHTRRVSSKERHYMG
jgi:hypothetical protein